LARSLVTCCGKNGIVRYIRQELIAGRHGRLPAVRPQSQRRQGKRI